MGTRIEKRGYTIVITNKDTTKPIQALISKVLLKTTSKKEKGLYGDIEIIDFDPKRVYLTANYNRFDIRMYDIECSPIGYRVTWSLFKMVKNERGSYGKEISYSQSLINKSKLAKA